MHQEIFFQKRHDNDGNINVDKITILLMHLKYLGLGEPLNNFLKVCMMLYDLINTKLVSIDPLPTGLYFRSYP